MAKSGFIAIAGRPNSGKSTLLNQVLGSELSIVTPKAQTTRERVLGILTEPGRGQIVFIDTPGIHKAKEGGINAFMMREVREGLEAANLVWVIVDPETILKRERVVLEHLALARVPVFLVLNKIDLIRTKAARARLEELVSAIEAEARALGVTLGRLFRISALTGEGTAELLAASWAKLPEGAMHYPDEEQLSDRPTRFFVAEKIREQLLLQLGDEIPYSCAVEITSFDESARPPRIEAVIYVERDSQKGMVIGKGGAKIKEIGKAARTKVEAFLGAHVFLGLQVKVLRDWSRDAEHLKRLGYNLPAPRRSA